MGERHWNPPPGDGAGLRPLGYYATKKKRKKKCTLLVQRARQQINLLLIIRTVEQISSLQKKEACVPTAAGLPPDSDAHLQDEKKVIQFNNGI